MMKLFILFISLFAFYTTLLYSETVKIGSLKTGTADNSIFIYNRLIKNNIELEQVRKLIGDKYIPSKIDFDKETLLLISAKGKNALDVELIKVEQTPEKNLEIIYSVKESKKEQLSILGINKYPFVIAIIEKSAKDINSVIFNETFTVSPIPANTALGEDVSYSNVLSNYEQLKIIDYIPLDVGNIWTYKIESESKNLEITHEVQAVSNGWSILNNYFGQSNIAMRIDPSGQLFVSSAKGEVRTFYNDSVHTSFVKEEIDTPAGKFNELMIVTIPKSDGLWFKDIYAKGVGLVYHEHESPKGSGKYILLNARVRGKSYGG